MENSSESVESKIHIFSERLRTIRNEKDISAREMSLSLGQNVNYINLIENGKRKPSLEMFLSICEYLNIAPDYFFRKTDSENINNSSDLYMETFNNLTDTQKQILADFIKSLKRNG